MRGDEGVHPFRDGRESGQSSIERQPECLAARMAESQEAGLGAACVAPTGRDVLNGTLELGARNCGILLLHLLERPVVDLLAREFLPVASPVGAKRAIAV